MAYNLILSICHLLDIILKANRLSGTKTDKEMTNFKVGQLARSRVEGKVIQIRRIKFKDGEWMLGVGRIAFTWVFAKDYEKYRKV